MPNIRTFESLKIPHFRLYMGGMLCQMAGMNMQMMAGQLLVYRLTGSATTLGAMSLAMALPMLFLALFGGVLADRVQKKYVIQMGLLSIATVSLAVALALSLGYLSPDKAGSWWILIASAVCQGTIMGLIMPALISIIPEIVGEGRLMNAISLTNLGMSMFRIMAPAIAGFLIDRFDFQAVYYTITGANLMAVIVFYRIPRTSEMAIRGSNALSNIKDGIQYLRSETVILFILGFSLLFTILSMPYVNLMPVFTEDILGVGASGMGALLAVSGIGAGLAALFLASLPNKKRGAMFLTCGILMGLVLTGFSFSSSWYLSLVLVFFTGIAQSGNMTLGSTITQYYVPSQYRGRVMSILMMNFGLQGIGAFLTGMLADNIGIQWAVGGLALILFVVALFAMSFLTSVRRLD